MPVSMATDETTDQQGGDPRPGGIIAPRLARRAARFASSPWDGPGLARPGAHPHPISLISGAPHPALVPVDRLRAAATVAWRGPIETGYSGARGYEPLRQWLASWLGDRQIQAQADDIVLTTGSQQGIDLVGRLFLDPGDAVIVEGPTYIGALQAFDTYEAAYVTAPMDDDGLIPEALAKILADREASGQPMPKLLYTVPTFQNPTGRVLTFERRKRVIEIAREYGIVVVEDDPYGELRFAGEPVPAMRALDPNVIYLGTFSKTIAPALRVGWIVSPPPLTTLFVNAREVNDVTGEAMSQRIVLFTVQDFLDGHIAGLRRAYGERCETLMSALTETLPSEVRVFRPEGGFFVWVELPKGTDAEDLLPFAAEAGVTFLPGGWFFSDRRAHHAIRLSFANTPLDELREGGRRVGTAVKALLASRER